MNSGLFHLENLQISVPRYYGNNFINKASFMTNDGQIFSIQKKKKKGKNLQAPDEVCNMRNGALPVSCSLLENSRMIFDRQG